MNSLLRRRMKVAEAAARLFSAAKECRCNLALIQGLTFFRVVPPIVVLVCSLLSGLLYAVDGDITPAEQRQNGAQFYRQHCASCHHISLRGSSHATELAGSSFQGSWRDRTTVDMLRHNRELMPPGNSRKLSEEQHLAIIAYVLEQNGHSLDFPITEQTPVSFVSGEVSEWTSWSEANDGEAAPAAARYVNQSIKDFTPVSEQDLTNPSADNWLSWRRTLDSHGHSPLTQVNRENVHQLKLAWVLSMRAGNNQVTPLVHNGVMFLVHADNVIQALDATNGDMLWEYSYPYAAGSKVGGGPMRNIAIYEHRLFMSTYDATLVAVDARNGEELWRTRKADYELGYTHSSGPIIAGGVVVSGLTGCARFTGIGCFITGHDPATGAELWRTSTIALPGDPNNRSWGGVPFELRAGSDTWIAGSYDPALGLFYIGTSQAKPWVAASRGMSTDDDALYTNSTLALDPRTGELKWYFQHIPGETINMEVAYERVLVDLDEHRWLFTIGKDGILWRLDRRNGEFQGFTETIEQNIFTLNHETGNVKYRPDIAAAEIGESFSVCPGIYGGHNWQSMAYSPKAKRLVIPLHQICTEMIGRNVDFVPGGGGFGGDSKTFAMPGSNGHLSKLVAVDVQSMKEVWSYSQRPMILTGTLTTAGGLAFFGDLDRYFQAVDLDTGKPVWRTRLGAALHGYPITYAVDGVQYIAVPTGIGVFQSVAATLSPDIYQPAGGHALYVFALP